MIIKPRIRGSLALNCHPLGCKKEVEDQIKYAKVSKKYKGAKKILILGASSGYGLSTRISLAFGGSMADTIGVSFEKEGSPTKIGSAGWYNNIWFKEAAEKEGLIAKNFIGDAFSNQMKEDVIKYIKEEFGGKIDLLVYSLASGLRLDPKSNILHRSTLKPIGKSVTGPTFNIQNEELENITLEPATEEDIQNTVKVMGGEDWELWVDALLKADVCETGFKSIAYSYIGAEITNFIYREGTIGKAKEHLESTAKKLNSRVNEKLNGEVYTAVNRAIVTKASAFIPIFPLYASVLFKIMSENGVEESCMEHTHRLFADMVYGDSPNFDKYGRMRPDSWEMNPKIQDITISTYKSVTFDNFKELSDFKRFKNYFMKANGFEKDGIDYECDVDLEWLATLKP